MSRIAEGVVWQMKNAVWDQSEKLTSAIYNKIIGQCYDAVSISRDDISLWGKVKKRERRECIL